jgi:hypothetical protein
MRDLDIIDSIAYALHEQSNGMSKTAGIKDKILAMFGAQKKPSAAATIGKGALAAGGGAGLLALIQKMMHKPAKVEGIFEKAVPLPYIPSGDTSKSLLDELREYGIMGADRA